MKMNNIRLENIFVNMKFWLILKEIEFFYLKPKANIIKIFYLIEYWITLKEGGKHILNFFPLLMKMYSLLQENDIKSKDVQK